MITFVDEKGTEHSALVAYSVTNAVNGELSVKGTIYTNDKVLHGIGRGWRFRLDDEYYRITYAKPNDTGRQIEVEFDAVHQFFYDMSKSMVYTTLNGSKPFETYLQAIFSGSGYTYNLETTVGSIRKENFGNKSRLSLFNDIIKVAGLEFSVRGHVVRILKRIGTDLSTIVRKDFNMNELKIEKNINSFVTYQRGIGAWKDDEDHSKGRYETSYESPLSAIYGRIEADPVVDERYKDTGKLLGRLKENVDKSYKVSVEIDMEDLSQAGYRISRPNPGDYIMAINETLGFRQKVRIVSFTSEYDVGGKLISRKVVCNDIGTVQRATSEISHLSRTLTDSIEGSERALKTATRALVSADGKNTNYFGDVKPLDVPKGTLRKGDRLFLTVGDKKQLYFWNGAEWELEPTEFDHEKFDMEFNRKSQEIKKTIQENRQKAEEALRNASSSSLIAQEAKRIGLDSIARLEAFKSQSTSAQTALSGDLDALKRTIANDIRPKQEQVTAEIAKQVEALNRTKNELAGVKSAQATYEETTTRRLAELSNLTDGKASKSELVQTAEELKSRIASVQASGRNLFLNSLFKQDIRKTGIWTTSTYTATIDSESKYLGHNALKIVGQDPTGRDSNNPKITYPATGQYGKVAPGSMTNQDVTISFYAKAEKAGTILRSRLGNINFKDGNVSLTTEVKRYVVKLPKSWTNWSKITTNEWLFNLSRADTVWIWMPKFEVSDTDTPYSEAPEDVEGLISAVESTFKQRADSLEASVSSLREGLKSKADSSALTLLSERISASVKSLETDTQNKLDSKLSTAEFEVRASGIRQEIINATKDKADKTLVTAEAGRLREELASQIGSGRNLWINSKIAGNPVVEALPAGHITGQKQCYKLTNNQELSFNIEPDFSSRLFRKVTFSAWVKYENVVRGANNWNVFNCFKHYMILKNSQTGTVSGASYLTLAGYDGTSDWKRIVFTYDYSANKGYDQLKTLLKFNLEGVRGGVAWITGVQVEFGSVANEYAPALEDVEGLITEAKATFERTAQGLRTDLSAIQKYVNKDGQRQEALQRYTREESARQATAVRELVTREFVGKSTYQEDVRGLERRFEAITNPQNGSIVTQIATYKNAVDGRFAEITSMISGKANQTDFQRVQETSRLYERILGNTNNSISDNVARMAMTSQLFQVEVGKYGSDGINRALNTSKGWTSFITIASPAGINLNADLHKVVASGLVAGDKLHVCLEISIDDVQPITGKTATAVLQSWGDVKKWNSGNPFGYRLGNLIAGNNWRKIEYDVTLTEQMLGNNFWWLNVRVDGASRYKVHTKLLKIEKGSRATPWSPAPEDSDEAIRTVQSQLAGSFAFQNLTSTGAIVSQINATNNQILIEAEKIRFKGKSLLDELTAIQGYFKRLFVGDANVGTLNSDIIRANSITADKLVMDMAMARMFVSSDIFTDTLAAKEAFINKLRSVVVTATLLEGYKGRIGGFQIGTHEKDSSVYWITGQNQFSVGMSNGSGQWSQTALWVNWGNNWGYPGDYAWYVKNNGKMYCYNTAEFWNTPVIHGDLRVTGHIYYNNENSGKSGYWIHSSKYSNFEPSNNYLYLYYSGSGYDWIPMNKEISDRRYKSNIQDSQVSGINVVESLKTYSYRKEYDGKIEDISCGIMAQDVQKYAPEAFFENPDGAYSYNTFALVPYLIKAIQELNQKIEKLEKTA